ncbi:MAG: ATP-grasp domain-containing protein [Cycloclasticus sp.]
MHSVLLVAPHNSYRIHAYIEAAKHLNIELVVASQSKHSLVSAVADGIQIDFSDDDVSLTRILKANEQYHFQAVITSDDGGVKLAAKVAQALDLSANHPDSAELTRRKDLARSRLKSSNVPVPFFKLIHLRQLLSPQLVDITYPVVVKPVSMSGSKGVIRADNQQQCVDALRRIEKIQAHVSEPIERDSVLLEAYISGKEVAYEGLLHKGVLKQLTIFDKPDPMEGPFFEETYYVTPTRLSAKEQALIETRVTQACAAYGLREGPVHAELRVQEDEAYIIEIASRTIGGDCADMLKFGLNIGVEELVLLQAMGKPIDIPALKHSVGVLMIPIPSQGILRRVEGIANAKKVGYITDVGISVREGYELTPLPEGSSYLGFIFAKAPTATLVEQALRQAHECLNIRIAPSFKLLQA